MGQKSHHVVPHPDGGWNVKSGGAKRASKHFNTKNEAISWARELSKHHHAELVIHNWDGTVSRKDSYATDQLPTVGRR